MKKAIVFLLTLVLAASLLTAAALADAVETIEGQVKASSFNAGVGGDVVLTGDIALTLDTDLSLRSIRGQIVTFLYNAVKDD